MVTKKKKEYSKPETMVFRIRMGQNLLITSASSVGLTGAGIDEGDADDNGTGIW